MNYKSIIYTFLIIIISYLISKKFSRVRENYYSPLPKSTSNFKNNNYKCPYVFNCPTRMYPTYDLRGHPSNPNFINPIYNKLFPYHYNQPFHPLSLHPVYWTNVDPEEVNEILNNKFKKQNKTNE
jgi:hypothetical protein